MNTSDLKSELSQEKECNSLGRSNQPTLLESIVKSQLFTIDYARATEISKRIDEMIALDNELSPLLIIPVL